MAGAPDLSIPSLFDVQGKTAIVTGGGSGIGEMIATAFVQNGVKVYIASRKEKQLKEVSERLTKMGPGYCHYFVADISSKEGCDKLADAVKQRENKIHILVNNSGMSWGAPYENVPEKEGWDRVLALNVKSIFYLTVAFTDLLAKDSTNIDPGRVINVSSIAGVSPVAQGSKVAGPSSGLWSYHTSKAAVTLASKRITVNAILPGIFPSKMTAFGFKLAGGQDQMAEGHPWGRVGNARDLAGVVLFLVSPAGSYVTASHIAIDGGSLYAPGKAFL
ncbi:hypothetical protein EWM64_g1225 [Hericium alpestre]|uniref:Rhamnolipids biosynthesis 3-oxoacyl-[acyl-carrier-protein] reductase n=1 Tax=Hericium alpestre TaxID=135208 RepID=A0A4Z0AB47_9AGAM|nr:hypothetical protein EWM64_g1225 [Hericium alpestre]